MSYSRRCYECNNPIFMIEINGIWYSCDDEMGNALHTCNGVKTSNSLIERVSSLEKFVRQLEKKIYLQQEQIAELRREKM